MEGSTRYGARMSRSPAYLLPFTSPYTTNRSADRNVEVQGSTARPRDTAEDAPHQRHV